ncbi:telomeric repeat-binding factor 2-interacting protein 1-like isoform X1 [Schistocerca gregaria]|uniref:telomeric repeat-binding factor 2-interacting protein 1-like isoform X1 n=2 Tax=Schistocerca gregaria TaxID=7010 RepID=UPI00211ECB13|nr:telomeric repeat-binding factor 2-interacting protein 1-like isoform X1 [Schistocerca gregaria]
MFEITCSTTLFTVGAFPMVFVLEENDKNKIIAQMIQHGGGCVASLRGPYGICLSSPENLLLLQNEAVFSTEFIKDCCIANRILDINQYRLGGPSSYSDNFNAMKVLLRKSHWPTPAERDENDSANTDRHSDSDTAMESQNSRRNMSSHRSRTFSGNEDKYILRYIVENKEIGLILGNTLWKKIAQKKLQGRTWQSLKKHFLKHVLPNITKYTFLSVTDRLEFQKHGKVPAESHDVTNSESKLQSGSSDPKTISVHKPTESGDTGSSSRAISQKHVEELRSSRLLSPCGSSVSTDASSLERGCGQRLPEKRKPFRINRFRESSESDSDDCPGNTDNQRLQDICRVKKSTSSRVRHENEGGRCPGKQDDLQHLEKNKAHTIQRRKLVINSSDEVDSGSEEHHRAPVVQRTNRDRRKSQDSSSSDDWFAATTQEQRNVNVKAISQKSKKLRKRHREEFTMEEEYAILAYLQKHNRFSNTGGNVVWKNMAATEPMGNRHTWHSLRERYLKKIVPNINKYNLPEEIVRRIKSKGSQPVAKKVSKHSLFA